MTDRPQGPDHESEMLGNQARRARGSESRQHVSPSLRTCWRQRRDGDSTEMETDGAGLPRLVEEAWISSPPELSTAPIGSLLKRCL